LPKILSDSKSRVFQEASPGMTQRVKKGLWPVQLGPLSAQSPLVVCLGSGAVFVYISELQGVPFEHLWVAKGRAEANLVKEVAHWHCRGGLENTDKGMSQPLWLEFVSVMVAVRDFKPQRIEPSQQKSSQKNDRDKKRLIF
jgi:hypothetical protein